MKKLINFFEKQRLKSKFVALVLDYSGIIIVLAFVILMMKDHIRFFNLMVNPQVVVISSALLGSFVGGMITYFVNMRVSVFQNHITKMMKNKSEIYEPLLKEYIKIKNELNKKVVHGFDRSKELRALNRIKYAEWDEIKNDMRYYQIPDFFRSECERVDEKVKKYESYYDEIRKLSLCEVQKLLNKFGIECSDLRSVALYLVMMEDVISEQKLYWDNLEENKKEIQGQITLEMREEIDKEFKRCIAVSDARESFRKNCEDLKASIGKVIDSSEIIIKRIIKTYERDNRIY